MRTINLQTVYQLVITALLLGACLGLLGQRLQWLNGSAPFLEQPIMAAPSFANPGAPAGAAAAQPQDVTTSNNNDSNVQVEVEVHTRGNANAEARACGPGDTEVKSSTQGEGDGRSAAYLKVPELPAWTSPVQPILVPTVAPPPPGQNNLPPGQPKAVVIEEMVNLRAAPTLNGAVLGSARRGQEFTIIGRDPTSTWWLVCCDQGQARWIYGGVVQVSGVVESVSVVDQPVAYNAPANTAPVGLPTPTMAPPLPTATPAPQYEFMLAEQAQFEERITPRIHLYVYETQEGLGGYMVSVRKDGQGLPTTAKTAYGMPGITWPIPNERQRYTNLKIEFPNVSPAGLWEIQLLDANGRPVGPVATFRLQPDDPRQELYVKYRKR